MRELKERLTEVDRVEFPEELWSTAFRRAAGEGVQEPVTRSPFRPAGRVAATTVALAVFVAAAIFLWNAFESRSQRPRPDETTPASNPLSQLPAGWNELPDPPDVRAGSAAAWTGSELLVWGGYAYTGFSDEEPLDDGYLLDPLTGSTETLPAAPLTARAFPAAAWTGSELIVWGGSDLRDGFFDDGAAYDPESGEWRALPQAPIEARRPFSAWTGSELLVWGSKWRDTRLVDGAAYDPAADSWRRIADAPLELTDGTAVWTGKEMIVFGAALHGGNQAESETAIGAAYDPATDSWRLLADSQLSPQASTAAWNGERMVAWDYLNQSQTYDPDRDEWGPVERVPLQEFECSPRSVSVSDSVLGEYCGQTTIYGDGGWSNISRRAYMGWGFELVAADPAVLLLGSNVDTGAKVLLAYRVPTNVGSTPSPSPQIDVSTVEIDHEGGIDVAVGEGSVWVSTVDGIVRIDSATGETLAEIAVGEPPFECAFDLAVGFGSVWATRGCEGGTEVVRIDPGTNQVVARVPLEQAYCVEVGEGAVWATASGAGLVARIDPASNQVVETIPVDAGSGPGGIGCLAAGSGGVWVTRGGDRDSLVRIDPTTNRIVATIDIPNPDYWNEVVVEGGVVMVAIGGPDVLLEDGGKTNVVRVVRIDPIANDVVGESIEVGYGMFGIGSGDGSVWVYDGFSDAITQIDAASGDVVRVIPVPDGGSSWGGDPGIDAGDGLVWMAGGKLLNRIDVSGS